MRLCAALWWLSLTACNPSCGVDDFSYEAMGGGGMAGQAGMGGALGGMGGAGGDGGMGGMPPALVFVTAASFPASFGGLDAADDICENAASLARVGGQSWVAWLSDETTDAITRVTDRSPWQLVDDNIAVSSFAQLAMNQPLLHAINLDETGAGTGATAVWTGTDAAGTATAETCLGWTSPGPLENGRAGNSDAVDARWTDSESRTCSSTARLYCFEQ